MTSWTDIPDTSVDQDSPITEELVTALRDNPKALAERDGASPHLNTTPLVSVETSSGSFVVPTGVTRLKVTATGGGQGGYAGTASGGSPTGGSGGTTSIARGATNLVRATGGSSSGPGIGTDGDLLIKGGRGHFGSGTSSGTGGHGGASFWGGGGYLSDGEAPGAGGGGGDGGDNDPPSWQPGKGGHAGGTAVGWFAVTPAETLTVTIGAGGTAGTAGTDGVDGYDGADGIMLIEY